MDSPVWGECIHMVLGVYIYGFWYENRVYIHT